MLPKFRNIIVIFLIAGALWHFYGESFEHSGIQGVYEEMRTDVNEIKNNPIIVSTVDQIQLLFGTLIGNLKDHEQPQSPVPLPEKPELESPSAQAFSIHNVELGDMRSEIEQQVGKPQRTSMNEYGVEWVTYHNNYHNFFMAAYNDENKVVGLYTNQDLLTSTSEISFSSTREYVLTKLGEPLEYLRKGFVNYQLQNDQEQNTFQLENHYVTIFFDKHENNTVTGILIISDNLERQKDSYFAAPSNSLKEGFEYQLFDLTNAARVNHGLSILSWDESVRMTVRDHSTDMADNNYFGHTNLQEQSPFDRLTEDNISYRLAGENLAAGQPSSIFAHEGLMNSLGHRENILNTDFEFLTVGVAFNEDAQPFYTENFLTK